MWLLGLIAGFLFFIGFVMWLCGADAATILVTVTIIAAVGFYLAIAACIDLVASAIVASGYPWAHVMPWGFLALVALIHWRALRR